MEADSKPKSKFYGMLKGDGYYDRKKGLARGREVGNAVVGEGGHCNIKRGRQSSTS